MNKNINKFVKEILETDKRARVDDFYLIAQVVKRMSYRVNTVSFLYVLEHAKDFNLPSFEAITRARRSVQRKNRIEQGWEELIDKEAQELRELEEHEYHNFYGGFRK
jgi:hypothetical protein